MADAPERQSGLPAEIGDSPTILILGSFPSVQALREGQYYRHRQNQFWRIMHDLAGIPLDLPYHERIALLQEQGIALWNIIHSCVREGSMDHRISRPKLADLPGLLERHPTIRHIALNGRKADDLLKRGFPEIVERYDLRRLPSTSPAYAQMHYDEKLAAWSVVRDWIAER
ncbi:DNA-deoxyinosine glycosylase [Methanoculleus sp. FWC-SCC1]|uniref:DNA-deoxyinosine glycosylase n=1 Tax=Methanoculleus frigidifontis TaxID=2584085 RepID=A0ABT8M5Z3_9EURY|nr:DNA-deoxyinosine glycosylase [Methanoculleus sp. FWC-SCC1]MDN7023357.1 DNA-deoxyinosine glycosylase [Methanoculleus sp. FWC-SCC1]